MTALLILGAMIVPVALGWLGLDRLGPSHVPTGRAT
jgi:hypothetical protein